MIEDSSY